MSWAYQLTESYQLTQLAPNGERKWKPFAPDGTPPVYPRDPRVELRHLRAELTLDHPGRSIGGTASLTLAPIAEPLGTLAVDAEEMKLSAVTCADAPLTWHHSGKVLTLSFEPALPVGQPVTVDITYHATPRRGLVFIAPDEDHPDKRSEVWSQCFDEDARCWLPCLDVPNVRCTSELIVTVPGGWFCLSNGELVERRANDDGTATFWWRQDVPHSSYLLALAAGEYAEIEDSWDGIPVNYYVPPDQVEDGARAFGRTPEMVAHFSELLGVRYPYAKYAQITATDFRYGGMENTTATVQTWRTLHDERAHLDTSSEGLVSHELSHQWFGDLVTCRDWSHAWLNEGFGTYMHNAWHRHAHGEDEFRWELYGAMRSFIGEDGGRYRRSIVNRVYKRPVDLFDAHIYQKGACVLNLIRTQIGDELFYRAMQLYLTRHAGRTVVTGDWQQALEDVTGRSYDRLFDQWIYHGGHPEFTVTTSWDDKAKCLALGIKQGQTPDEMTSIFQLPVKVRFVGEGYDETRGFDLTQADHTFQVLLPGRPQWVAFDPGNTVPKTLELSLDEDLLKAQLASDDDVMGRVYAAQALGKKATLAATEALSDAQRGDSFWAVRAECAAALSSIRTQRAFEALAAATGEEHPKARRAIVRALGAWRSAAAFEALLPIARGDASYHVEAEALDALARTRDARAWDELVAALDRDSHHDTVRGTALRGLVSLDAERALPIVETWCAPRTPETVRNGAFHQLVRATKESGARDHVKGRVRRLLESVLDRGHYHEQTSALGALGALGDTAAIGAVAAIKAGGGDPGLVKPAEGALNALRDAGGLPPEVKALREELDKVKEEAAELKAKVEKLEGRVKGEEPAPEA